MKAYQKDQIIGAFEQNERDIQRVAGYIAEAATDCTRVHSANGNNIAGYAANLVQYKEYRHGMIQMLILLGIMPIFDGEVLVDIREMEA